MSRIFYLDIDLFKDELFPFIRSIVYDESLDYQPIYENEKFGMSELVKFLDLVKNKHYYSTFFDKAAYLFTTISRGHVFKNGNKRLALVTLYAFIGYNNYKFQPKTLVFWNKWFDSNFTSYKIEDNPHDYATFHGWAFYNINRAINSSLNEFSFNDFKKIMKNLLQQILRKG